jgi:hypothetical protein
MPIADVYIFPMAAKISISVTARGKPNQDKLLLVEVNSFAKVT